MNTFYKTFIKMEIKKMFHYFPVIFLGSLGILSALSLIFFTVSSVNKDSKKMSTISIGIVADENEPFLDWIIQAAKNMDATKYTCKFHNYSLKDGNNALAEGKINALFLIPENYINSIILGENKHVTVRFSNNQSGIVNYILTELSKVASTYIISSEAGIYSMQDYYRHNNLPNEVSDELKLNIKYIKEIATLNNSMKETKITAMDSHDMFKGYIVSGIILFLLLWGTILGNLFTKENPCFYSQLKNNNIGIIKQTTGSNFSFFLLNIFNYVCISLLIFVLLFCFTNISLPNYFIFLIGSAPVIWVTSSYIQMVFKFAKDSMSGVLFILFSSVILGFLSDFFYSIKYFPGIVRTVCKLLPTYICKNYLMDIINENFNINYLILILIFSICFICATIIKVSEISVSPSPFRKTISVNSPFCENNIIVTYFVITMKRIFRKPVFIFLLFMIPLCTLFLKYSDTKDDSILKIAVLSQNNSSDMTRFFSESLYKSSNKNIKFFSCKTKKELTNLVSDGSASCGYILPQNLSEGIRNYTTDSTPFIEVIRPKNNSFTKIVDEIILSKLYNDISFEIVSNFVSPTSDSDRDKLKNNFYSYLSDELLVEFDYLESSQKIENFLLQPLRGIFATFILLGSLCGCLILYEDENTGLFALLSTKGKILSTFFSIYLPGLLLIPVTLFCLKISGIYENNLEPFCILSFHFAAFGLALLLKKIIKKTGLFLITIPVILFGCLILSPVFFDIGTFFKYFNWTKNFLPLNWYLTSLYNQKYIIYMILLGIVPSVIFFVEVNYLHKS